jgi:phosphatidylserine/phosphatidylglycerophosphate/cardiolipin synthase-like enzyme
MSADFEVSGTSATALFTLKLHRGDGMVLLAMNWKSGPPPNDFVGFAIEYKEPGGQKFYALKNRIAFETPAGKVNPNTLSTLQSPIQKFRWVHFPLNANLDGAFTYRVTPVFMNDKDELSLGDPQLADIELRRDTYPGLLNVAFTRGFISSQAFVDNYGAASIPKLLPSNADKGLTFKPTYPNAEKAYAWMGFEAREAILDVLDEAIADATARVSVIAYDFNEPEVVSRLVKLGSRLHAIIDNSGSHDGSSSAESAAEAQLKKSAGQKNVIRQHMRDLQHNKIIIVDGATKVVVCGSTNFSWRGFYVQNNNAMVLQGNTAVQAFTAAFQRYWNDDPQHKFETGDAKEWTPLGLAGIDAAVTFSPHASFPRLADVGTDIATHTTSSLFYSLAFLYQTSGPIRDAITTITKNKKYFVYGISDRKVGGLDVQKPDGNVAPVYPAELSANLPEPFKSEPTGGAGIRMHHKFVVIDFDKPTACVYMGSYNFSGPADTQNGENLLRIRDRRIAVSYMVEALRLFDHYHFRVAQKEAKKAKKKLVLLRPPRKKGEKTWFADYYSDPHKIRDRELFA